MQLQARASQPLALLLVLFMFSGQFTIDRVIPFVGGIEIRWAFLLLAILVAVVIAPRVRFGIRPFVLQFSVWAICLLMLTFVSTFWASNKVFAVALFPDLIAVLIQIYLTGLVLCLTDIDSLILLLRKITVSFAVCYSVVVVLTALAYGSRGSIIIGGPNVATRVIFFGLVLSMEPRNRSRGVLSIVLTVLMGAAIVLLGSRGGIVGAAISLLVYFLLHHRKRLVSARPKMTTFLAVLFSLFVVVFPLRGPIASVVENRVVRLLLMEQYTAGRDALFRTSWDHIVERPLFGHGLGAYYGFLGNYPHNIFLELMIDGGFALVLVIAPLVLAAISIVWRSSRGSGSPICILPLYMLVVSSFSGDLYDFRYFFFWLPIAYLEWSSRGRGRGEVRFASPHQQAVA